MMSEMPFTVSRSGLTADRPADRPASFLRIVGILAIWDPELPLAHPGAVHNDATDLWIECI